MCVNHRGADIGLTQQLLHRPDVSSSLQQMRGKGMTLAGSFADGLGIGSIVLTFLTRQAIGRHKLRRDQTGCMTKSSEHTRPVVST